MAYREQLFSCFHIQCQTYSQRSALRQRKWLLSSQTKYLLSVPGEISLGQWSDRSEKSGAMAVQDNAQPTTELWELQWTLPYYWWPLNSSNVTVFTVFLCVKTPVCALQFALFCLVSHVIHDVMIVKFIHWAFAKCTGIDFFLPMFPFLLFPLSLSVLLSFVFPQRKLICFSYFFPPASFLVSFTVKTIRLPA